MILNGVNGSAISPPWGWRQGSALALPPDPCPMVSDHSCTGLVCNFASADCKAVVLVRVRLCFVLVVVLVVVVVVSLWW